MISHFLMVFVFASVFSCISSKKDHFTPSLLATQKTPILVRNNQEEIKIKYYNSSELKDFMSEFTTNGKLVNSKSLALSFPNLKNIWAVHISSDAHAKPRTLLKPMFKFVANIHGDDAVGLALMVTLIQYLVKNYGYDDRVTRIMNQTDIWIVPSLNPEGFDQSETGRFDTLPNEMGLANYNAVDIDQNFPPLSVVSLGPTVRHMRVPCLHGKRIKSKLESETQVMMDFIRDNPFVLSANIQGGAVVASYPFDFKQKGKILTPDNEFFMKVAEDYVNSNPMMSGITNGNFWRMKRGSMQDYNYLYSNCFEISLYVGNCKYPRPEYLPIYWHANLESMLTLIESTRLGVYGLVRDEEGCAIAEAIIHVKGIDKKVKTTLYGEYWRLLVPGSYNVTASARGYKSVTYLVKVTKENPYVHQNFLLTK